MKNNNNKNNLLSITLMIFVLVSHSAYAISLQEAIESTLENHPRLNAGKSGIRSIEFEYEAIEASKKPKVKLITGLSQRSSLNNKQGLEVSYTLYDGGRTQYTLDQKELEIEASHHELNNQEETLILEAVEAYINVAQLKESIQLAQDYVIKNKHALELITDLVKARLRDRSILELAKARYEQAEIAVLQKKINLASAKTGFKRVVGEPALDIVKPPVVIPKYDTFDDFFDIAAQNSYQMKSLQAETERIKIQKKLADSWKKPSIILTGQLAHNSRKESSRYFFNDSALSLDVEWDLYDGNASEANASATNELVMKSLSIEQDKKREVRDAVERVWTKYQNNKHQQVLNKRNTRASLQVLKATKSQFKLGKKSLLDVLNSEKELYQAKETELANAYEMLADGYRVLASQGLLKEHFRK